MNMTKQCKNALHSLSWNIKQNQDKTKQNDKIEGDDLHLYFITSVPFKSGIWKKKEWQIHTRVLTNNACNVHNCIDAHTIKVFFCKCNNKCWARRREKDTHNIKRRKEILERMVNEWMIYNAINDVFCILHRPN